MTPEDRLRAAIDARTTSVEPSTDGFHHIEEKLMDVQRSVQRNRLILGIAAAAAAVAVVVGVLAITRDDDKIRTAGTTSTTDGTTSSTDSTSSSTTTSAVPATVDPTTPVFPDPASSRRFDDPVAVARAFATDMVGFSDPVLGSFAQGDSRSGEVEVRAFAQGQPTTVLVRQLEDDTWFVLGASVASIRLDTPAAGATIGSPQALAGAAQAFEGHVAVHLYVDGVNEQIGEAFVTGRGDAMGDFTGELTFTLPAGAQHGVLVLVEPSAKDGATIAATVIRVHF
jgi:hypothetical protein